MIRVQSAAVQRPRALSPRAHTCKEQTFEYPLVQGIPADQRILPLSQLETPNIDLSNLDDLNGTLKLMRELGIL